LTRAYLGLGSNLGDRLAFLQSAVDECAGTDGVRVVAVSSVYETAPVGGPPQDDYLNAVVAIDTELDPSALLGLAHRCEEHAGRVRSTRFGPRTLDVDILLYGDLHLDDPALTIPHPRMWERGFVLAPLRELVPGLVDDTGSWPDVRIASVRLHVPPAR
jgi:2-amino-4-hydroxy-6-hydroxymethyldihydropteridine diphosphokinase